MMTEGSFQFGALNSLEDLGIYCEVYDTLFPPKRSRKVQIPGKNGVYDYGANTYDERRITVDCTLKDQITKDELREIAYKLSGKKKLVFWDEPDKCYIGELYDAVDIDNYGDRLFLKFRLTFICEPFAYGETVTEPIETGDNQFEYRGTQKTPCLIVLKNTSDSEINNVQIRAVIKK